ncbi:hypothetical protein A2U01_0063111 [Trifolium medium]|uniref:Uncharacterized protein n=1 Tax=Trifolium medium TaxID=97028 RepID=A0A392S0F3_9FABA|nr:hypothetical protein [Trifolium medium]
MLQAPKCTLKHQQNKSVPVLLAQRGLVTTGENNSEEKLILANSGEHHSPGDGIFRPATTQEQASSPELAARLAR